MNSQSSIIKAAQAETVRRSQPAPNRHPRNSIEYRYWQDGVRMGMDEVYEQEGIAA